MIDLSIRGDIQVYCSKFVAGHEKILNDKVYIENYEKLKLGPTLIL